MLSNRLVFAALALACVLAAGLGGYVATRQATESTGLAAAATGERGAPPSATPAPTSSVLANATEPKAGALTPPAEPSGVAATADPASTTHQATRNRTEPASRIPASGRARRATRPNAESVRNNPDAHTTTPQVAAPPAAEPVDPSTPADSRDVTADPPALADVAPAPPTGATNDIADSGPELEELVVSADSVIGLHVQHGVSSETARVEDEVDARVVRDVRVGRRVAIPAGARALGSVTLVERGGRFKERARLGIRFHTLVLGDGSRLPISTDAIYRYGDAQGDKSAKKIGGGAVAGAILGAIIGGAKGAAVGATAGAGGGTAMVIAGDRSAAEFPTGSAVTARILSPITVTVER